MAQKKKTDIDDERAKLAEAAEQLKKAAEILGNMQQSSEAPASASGNRSAKPKSASSSKSSTAKKPQTSKAPAKKASAQNAGKPAAKKPAAKQAPAEKAESTEAEPPAETATEQTPPQKKSATKKPAAKKAETADKPAAKKTAAKKVPAQKAEPTIAAPTDEPTEEQKPTEPVAAAARETATVSEEPPKEERIEEIPPEPTAEEPKEQPTAESAPEPTAEEPKEQPTAESAPEPTEEPKEEPARIPCPNCGADIPAHAAFCNKCGAKVDEPPQAPKSKKKEKPAPAPNTEAAATEGRKRGAAAKTDDFIKNKGKLPIFITVNALFLVAAVILLFVAYEDKNGIYNVFQYFSSANSAAIKAFLVEQSTGWGGGAYTMLGILMIIAVLVPLALIIKNIVILCVKKDKSVYRLDAIIAFAAMLFYISIVNLFGAYIAAGPIVALIITGIIFVFIIVAQLVGRTDKPLPIYSFVAIPLITVALLTFTYEVYTGANGNKAWCASAASSDIAGPALFVFMLIVVVALIAMLVLQMKSIRGIVGKIIDTLIALDLMGFAVLSLAMAGGSLVLMESNPDNISLYGSFVVGGVLAILLAISWLLFTWIRPLNRVKHTLDTSEEKPARRAAVEEPAPATVAEQPSVAETQAAPQAQEQPTEEIVEYEFCRKCGTKNVVGTKFCQGCGAEID